MTHQLDDAKLKVQRAGLHINSLESAIGKAEAQPGFSFHAKGELAVPALRGASIYVLEVDPAIGLDWGVIVGDILSNLRASLDHVAWALAMQRSEASGTPLTPSQEKSVYFPLRVERAEKPYRAEAVLSQSDVAFFPKEAWDTVDYYQPYHRGERPPTGLLGNIAELANEDKHRIVTPVRREAKLTMAGDDESMRARLRERGEFLFLVTDEMRDKVRPEATFDVVISVPSMFPNVFAVSNFSRVYNLIGDELIPAFEEFCP